MALKDQSKSRPQTLNQRLEHWLDHSAPAWFRYLARFEWHTRPETVANQLLGYWLPILVVIALLLYTFS